MNVLSSTVEVIVARAEMSPLQLCLLYKIFVIKNGMVVREGGRDIFENKGDTI